MRKEILFKILYVIAAILFLSFTVILLLDYVRYNEYENSAPFSAIMLSRFIIFVIPAIVCIIVAKIGLKNK